MEGKREIVKSIEDTVRERNSPTKKFIVKLTCLAIYPVKKFLPFSDNIRTCNIQNGKEKKKRSTERRKFHTHSLTHTHSSICIWPNEPHKLCAVPVNTLTHTHTCLDMIYKSIYMYIDNISKFTVRNSQSFLLPDGTLRRVCTVHLHV